MLGEAAISSSWRHWSHSNFLPCGYQHQATVQMPWMDFSTSQYLRVNSLVKTWIICAYAICDAWCVSDANQKGRFMAATTDMANALFAMGRMGWCIALL